jgi:hypothetical protein
MIALPILPVSLSQCNEESLKGDYQLIVLQYYFEVFVREIRHRMKYVSFVVIWSVCVLMPLYAGLKLHGSFHTYQVQYIWTISACYLKGIVPAVIIWFCFIVLLSSYMSRILQSWTSVVTLAFPSTTSNKYNVTRRKSRTDKLSLDSSHDTVAMNSVSSDAVPSTLWQSDDNEMNESASIWFNDTRSLPSRRNQHSISKLVSDVHVSEIEQTERHTRDTISMPSPSLLNAKEPIDDEVITS